MVHWSDVYVGKPYIPESVDCAALAQKVARDILKIDPQLPSDHAVNYRAQSRQILAHKDEYAVKIDSPEDAQPVLLIARGRLCHIGVMCRIAGEWWILHADQSAGYVIRQREREITRLHYKIEGYYRWINSFNPR